VQSANTLTTGPVVVAALVLVGAGSEVVVGGSGLVVATSRPVAGVVEVAPGSVSLAVQAPSTNANNSAGTSLAARPSA